MRRLKPVRVEGAVATYRVTTVQTRRIRRVRLKAPRVRRTLRLSRVRRAARRGFLRVRVVHRGPRRHHRARRARLILFTAAARRGHPGSAACVASVSDFGVGAWPSACWRPYADSSPFNRPLPANPRVAPGSAAIVRRVAGFGGPDHVTVGNSGSRWDYSHPTYYSRPGDPEYVLHCTEQWGRCEIEGETVRVPDAATAAAGSDGHMTVIDTASGWEYDLWAVKSKERGGGRLDFGWGGRTRVDGPGNGSGATASGFGNLAGIIRAQELAAGEIRHALFMVVKCSSGGKVYPVTGGAGSACDDRSGAPPMGSRFQLDMSDAEIAVLPVPGWKKTILRAMARYGMYMGDTGSGGWGIQMESGATYTSFGYEDPLVTFARSVGAPRFDGNFVLNIRDGVDWGARLRVVDPCVSDGGC